MCGALLLLSLYTYVRVKQGAYAAVKSRMPSEESLTAARLRHWTVGRLAKLGRLLCFAAAAKPEPERAYLPQAKVSSLEGRVHAG